MRVSTKVVIDLETGVELERESYWYEGPAEECRGENKQGAAAADEERRKQDAMNQQFLAQQQQVGNLLLPGYQNLINNPGYDAKTKAGIVNTGEGVAAAAYGSEADQMNRNAARTGNAAGVVEGEERLARDKATTLSDLAAKEQVQFADAARSDVRAGLAGESGLYGIDTNLLARTLGLPVEYINAQTAAKAPKGPQPGVSWSWGSGLGVNV